MKHIEGTALRIQTVTGLHIEVKAGPSGIAYREDCACYYCAGRSWPAEIVVEVIA